MADAAEVHRPQGKRRRPPSGSRHLILFFVVSCMAYVQAFGHHAPFATRTNGGGCARSGKVARALGKHPNEGESGRGPSETSRRTILSNIGASAAVATAAVLGSWSPAAAAALDSSTDDAYPPITHKVYFDVRISRSDGSFYVRDDLPDIQENRVVTGRLTFGLFGTVAPRHVEQFLRYVEVPYNPADDSPLPSYAKSKFTQLDQSTGLLLGGVIPGLDLTEIGGGTNMKYGGRVLPAPLWIEPRGKGDAVENKKVSHSLGTGLITHRTLEALPIFGVTTRPSQELDSTHVVFGRILPDDTSREFLLTCVDLPTYSIDRPSTPAEAPKSVGERATEEAAGRVFAVQREFFRGAAKTFGDTRVDKVYEGKLLRRVEVTKVGLL